MERQIILFLEFYLITSTEFLAIILLSWLPSSQNGNRGYLFPCDYWMFDMFSLLVPWKVIFDRQWEFCVMKSVAGWLVRRNILMHVSLRNWLHNVSVQSMIVQFDPRPPSRHACPPIIAANSFEDTHCNVHIEACLSFDNVSRMIYVLAHF